RQKLMLSLLSALGGRVANLDFRMLLFLFCRQAGDSAPYEFVPYKDGAFSFTSDADRHKLASLGLLTGSDYYWELTDAGREAASAGRDTQIRISEIVRRYGKKRGDGLLAETYRLFPYYAIRSGITKRVLKG